VASSYSPLARSERREVMVDVVACRTVRWGALLALATATALAAACGGGEEDARPAEPSGETAIEREAPPAGTEEPVVAGEPPGEEGLAGIWLLDGSDRLMRLSRDGTFAIDDRGTLDTEPAVAGTFALEERTVRFASAGSALCEEGDRWSWEAGIIEEGRMETIVREDGDGRCALGVGARLAWARVSPASPAGAGLAGSVEGVEPVSPAAEILVGIWLLEGTGVLLRLGSDGTYALDDDGELGPGPGDAGTFELDEAGTLTLTSAAGSERCAEGDRWAWQALELLAGPSTEDAAGVAQRGDWVLLVDAARDDCGRGVPDGARWLLLSP
jgi:hypothetical protein